MFSSRSQTLPILLLVASCFLVDIAFGQETTTSKSSTTTPAIDWTRDVVVLHDETTIVMKMEETKVMPIVISLMCDSPDVMYTITLETYIKDVAYFSNKQDATIFISCADSVSDASKDLNRGSDGIKTETDSGTPRPITGGPIIPSFKLQRVISPHLGDDDDDSSLANEVAKGKQLSPFPRMFYQTNFTIVADLLGRTWLMFVSNKTSDQYPQGFIGYQVKEKLETENDSILIIENAPKDQRTSSKGQVVHEIPVIVLRNLRTIDVVFRIVLYTFVALAAVGMGCKTDLKIVKEVLKKPVAPVMGFIAQYICMPLIAYTLSQVVHFDNPAVRLGIFACGVCPGGGASNIFSYLLNGDISLSVTMTCISSVGAMAMIPLWMFTLGQKFNDDKIAVTVPFLKILETLAIVVIPLFVGFFLNIKLPKIAAKFKKLITPIAIITILFVLTVGVYSNLYMFRLFKGGTVVAACLLPYIGYILGGLLALISRQPWPRIKTVSIETGIQNTSVAYLMLTFSLPAPDSDLAAVGSAASALMTPLPLLVISILYTIYNKWKKKGDTGEDTDDENKNNQKKVEKLQGKRETCSDEGESCPMNEVRKTSKTNGKLLMST